MAKNDLLKESVNSHFKNADHFVVKHILREPCLLGGPRNMLPSNLVQCFFFFFLNLSIFVKMVKSILLFVCFFAMFLCIHYGL